MKSLSLVNETKISLHSTFGVLESNLKVLNNKVLLLDNYVFTIQSENPPQCHSEFE